MSMDGSPLPDALANIPLRGLRRIDLALEGAWSETVAPLWTPEGGFAGFSRAPAPHPDRKPALELYFDEWWIGIHCWQRTDGRYVLDEERARAIVAWVEEALVRDEMSKGRRGG